MPSLPSPNPQDVSLPGSGDRHKHGDVSGDVASLWLARRIWRSA